MTDIYTTFYTPSDTEKKFHQEHRLGRALLAEGLKRSFGIDLTAEETEVLTKIEENGKPYLAGHPEIQFNISHCDGLIVCAFSAHHIGVDAECPRTFTPSLLRRLFTPEERSFYDTLATSEEKSIEWMYRFWTLKESYVKYSGLGLRRELNSFSFTFTGTNDPYEIHCSESDACFSQYPYGDRFLISVCTEAPEPIRFIELSLQ